MTIDITIGTAIEINSLLGGITPILFSAGDPSAADTAIVFSDMFIPLYVLFGLFNIHCSPKATRTRHMIP
jgi:hypothetical protein